MLRRLLFLLILPPLALHAKDLSPDEMQHLERRFSEVQKSTRTLRADFKQEIRMPGMRRPVVSKGEFLYRAPDDLRVTFTEPPGDYLLLHGETLEMSRGGKPPVKKSSTDRAAKALVALRQVLRGSPEEADAGMNHKIRREDGQYIITITPTSRSPQLPEKIENRVDADSLILRNMAITLPRGIHLEYRLAHPRRDVPIAPGTFEMKP